jgi:hypothetical protein
MLVAAHAKSRFEQRVLGSICLQNKVQGKVKMKNKRLACVGRQSSRIRLTLEALVLLVLLLPAGLLRIPLLEAR